MFFFRKKHFFIAIYFVNRTKKVKKNIDLRLPDLYNYISDKEAIWKVMYLKK